jgi:hypothetical protein
MCQCWWFVQCSSVFSGGLEFPRIGIELRFDLGQIVSVKVPIKRRTKSNAALLDHATNNLLRGLKQDMVKKDGRVDQDKLRKDGYSDRLLTKLDQA